MTRPLKSWSFSAYKAWKTCPKQFKHRKLDGHKQPTTPALARGREVHDALANFIVGKTDHLHDAVKDGRQRALYGLMRAHPHKIVEQQWGYRINWRPTGWFAKDTYFRSVLDVLLQYDDGTGEIIDHKTGRKDDSYSDQMELFAISTFSRFETVSSVTTRLVYVDAVDQEICDFSRADFEPLKEKWTEAVKPMFHDTTWEPRPNEYCKYCELGRSKGGDCPHG